MKKFNKIFSMSLAAMLVAGLFSCVEEAPEYVGGEADIKDCPGAFFPTQEAAGDHTFDPTMERTLNVTISRTDSVVLNEISVPVAITADSKGIYVVNGTPIDSATVVNITMPKGAKEVTFPITFEKAETAVKYNLSAQITDNNYASIYNVEPKSLNLSVFCVEWKWLKTEDGKDVATVTWNQGWWGETCIGRVKYYEVDGVRYCQTVSDRHIYNGEEYEGYGFFGTAETPEDAVEWNFIWYTEDQNGEGNDFVQVPSQNTGYFNSNYDAYVWVYDYVGYWNDVNSNHYGFDFLEFAYDYGDPDGTYPVSYYDGHGGFYFYIKTYYMIGIGGWTQESYETIGIADGYTRVDYSIEAQAAETTAEGVVPVSFTLGADVDTVKYVVAEGKLNDAAVKKMVTAITEDKAENVKILDDFENPVIAVSADSTGIYTLVAVSYAKNEAKENTAVSFTFVTPEDMEDYAAIVTVGTEPTSAMYDHVGYNDINSFMGYVYGEGLTDVKMDIVKTADLAKTDPTTFDSVDEETLAAINGDGFITMFSGLAAETDYTFVVWASNGYRSTVATASYTTAEDPETWHALGVGSYTDDCVAPLYSADPVTYEVNIEESDKTPGRYRLIYPYGAAYPYNEPGDYDESQSYDVIVMATDPTSVYINEQPLGLDWGDGMFTLLTNSARYLAAGYSIEVIKANDIPFGTLEDGVITFPVDEVLCGLGGSLYYANRNGQMKIVLPEAYKASQVPASIARPASQMVGAKANKSHIIPVFERNPQTVAVKAVKAEKVSGRNMSAKKADLKVAF